MGFRAQCVVLLALASVTIMAQETPPPPPANASTTVTSISEMPYKPQFAGDPARSRSEAVALGYMRTVADAERAYKKKHTKYAMSLQTLVGSGSFTRRMLKTDRGDYTVGFHPVGQGWSLAMVPKQVESRRRAFFMEDNGIIHVEEDKIATASSPVLRPDNP